MAKSYYMKENYKFILIMVNDWLSFWFNK